MTKLSLWLIRITKSKQREMVKQIMAADPHSDSSYIDYETFLAADFSPHNFANGLILHTNTSDDLNLDLSTPLSGVLFDLQEIDSHIHALSTGNAPELLEYAGESRSISEELVKGVEAQMKIVNTAYKRLEKEIVPRSKAAEEVLRVVERLNEVMRVLRAVGRVVLLGRQLEGLLNEYLSSKGVGTTAGAGDWWVLLRTGYTVAELRKMVEVSRNLTVEAGGVPELEGIQTVTVVVSQLLVPAEQFLQTTASATLMGFPLPTSATTVAAGQSVTASSIFTAQKSLEATLSRVSCAIKILHLLSPPTTAPNTTASTESPLLTSLHSFLDNQTTTSLSALSRVFSSLTPTQPSPPAFDRSLSEIVSKIRAIVLLEEVLGNIPLSALNPSGYFAPTLPTTEELLSVDDPDDVETDSRDVPDSLLSQLLSELDTTTLPTLFFRNLASGLESLVRNVLARGGIAARGLRAGKDKLREGLQGVVERGLTGEIDGGGSYTSVSRRGIGRAGKRKRKQGERDVGVGVLIGGIERGFLGK